MENFALIGAAGFVAPRHLRAIQQTGNQLVAAADPHDSVGVLDRYFPRARYFSEIERFDRFLEKLRLQQSDRRISYISICSPNYLHDAHVRLALRVGAHAICEKPLVINPWNLDQLSALEASYGQRVFTVLQLRLLPAMKALKEKLDAERPDKPHDVLVSYVTRRGPWYHVSWKGLEAKSGGVAMNIGVHIFDLLTWLFGKMEHTTVHLADPSRMAGALALERARVRWLLSVDERDLPEEARAAGRFAHREITVDGVPLDLTTGFEDLHTRVYEETLAGRGFGIEDARDSIALVHAIRTSRVSTDRSTGLHPTLAA